MCHKIVGIDDLEGWWLDYVIAREICKLHTTVSWMPGGYGASLTVSSDEVEWTRFSPSGLWSDAGPLIGRYKISLQHQDGAGWEASVPNGKIYKDLNPLIAAMKALAHSTGQDTFSIQSYT